MRKIIHVDADSFYASVEIRENPALKGAAVAVGGAAQRRGVIATCNYEARRWGVKSAMPTAQALRLCPELVLVAPRMELYRQVSAEMRSIFHDYTDLVEPLSLDEAFLDVTGTEICQGSATRIAMQIRQRVEQELGLTVSAGVAPNKFLAKIASDWNKPDGMFVITPEQVDEFVLALPVNKLHGVGKVTANKLHRMGINHCWQLRQRSQIQLVKSFGKLGERLWQLAHGMDERAVIADSRRQSLSVETTFAEDLKDLPSCLAQLPNLLQDLHRRYSRLDSGYQIASLFVKIKFADFTQTTSEQVADGLNQQVLARLLAQSYARAGKPVRLLGIGARFKNNESDLLQLNLPLGID